LGIGDWGLGIGDWGLGIGDGGLGIGDRGLRPIPNPQSPIPNPQSPIPIKYIYEFLKTYKYLKKININKNFIIFKIFIHYIYII